MPDDRNYAVNSGGPIHVDGVEVPWPGYVASAGPMVDWIVVTSWPAASGREAWRQVFVASVLRDENFQTGDPLDIRLGFADHPFLFPTLRYGGRWVPAVYPTIAAGYYSPYLDELGLLLPAAETELVEAVHDACDEHDATSWCNLLVLTAAMHPHPDDHV
uniref:Uncharacterized protein n=1 Tax=Sipha flava TaxID=143950 RepID=A0A2S2R6L3_9HEMI